MLKFNIGELPPVQLEVNGKQYTVPRFLLPQITEWQEEQDQQRIERATAHLNPEDKARFLMYHEPLLLDVANIAAYFQSPGGIKWLLEHQLPKAEPPVDDETIALLMNNGDPIYLRELAIQISSTSMAGAFLKQESGDPKGGGTKKDDPLAKPEPTSVDSQSTGESSTTSTKLSTEPKRKDSRSTST